MPSKSRKKIKGQARKANAKSNAALVIINSVGQNQWNVIDYRGSALASFKREKKKFERKKKLRLNAHMERSQEKVNDYSFSLLINSILKKKSKKQTTNR